MDDGKCPSVAPRRRSFSSRCSPRMPASTTQRPASTLTSWRRACAQVDGDDVARGWRAPTTPLPAPKGSA